MPKGKGTKAIAQNKTRHDYFIDQVLEAGIELKGTEVKSLRQGKANLRDSYVTIDSGEAFAKHMHISPYEQGNIFNVDPLRPRRLLLHKQEITKLAALTSQKGLTLIPLSLYFRDGRVKLELGVARGKKLYDKRQSIAERDAGREIERRMKDARR